MNADEEIRDDTRERDPQTYAIIGACMAVHTELGNGFAESVYQDALAVELRASSIPFLRERKLQVTYKGQLLQSYYKADFVCYESIIVECKAVTAFAPTHDLQVLNYLKATRFERALLVNFALPRLYYKRLILSQMIAGPDT